MADLSKFKRRGGLGAPPPITEASVNLHAPEVAPAPTASPEIAPPNSLSPPPVVPTVAREGERIDGRTARRTGRTVPFGTRVSEAFDARFRSITARDKLLMVELLERALDAYEAQRAG